MWASELETSPQDFLGGCVLAPVRLQVLELWQGFLSGPVPQETAAVKQVQGCAPLPQEGSIGVDV